MHTVRDFKKPNSSSDKFINLRVQIFHYIWTLNFKKTLFHFDAMNNFQKGGHLIKDW
jgi:hypothetical protein